LRANVLAFGRVEGLAVGAREVVVEVNKVIAISLKRRLLAYPSVIDSDRLGNQLLVGKSMRSSSN
jgi:hypothetical protein